MTKSHIGIFFIFLVLFACNNKESLLSEEIDTRKLVAEAHEKIGPLNITYTLNKERGQIYYNEAKNKKGAERLNLLLKYATEMLNGGDTQLAIETFNNVLLETKKSSSNLTREMKIRLKSALAISYMRLGEQENCIQNHNHQSCIVPIQNDGIHTLTEGSSKAIDILNEILSLDKNHKQSIWLLNLAHMTLGTYPHKVPTEFLLSPDYFSQNKDILPVFENIASQIGLDDNGLSGGAIFDDFDNDGDLDLIASSWGIYDQIKYYINDGNGKFEESAKSKGLDGVLGGLNIKQTDYNNDGYLDLYIMRGAWMRWDGRIPNTLLKNNGDGSFTDVTIQAGLVIHTPTQSSSWSDFNLDGWLDLLVVSESFDTLQCPTQLWLNNKDGTFRDVGQEAGLLYSGYFKGVSVDDINNDGLPDIYITNLSGNNLFYLHQGITINGIPTFRELGKLLGIQSPQSSFPCAIFDFNNDGLFDILVSSFKSKINNPAADFTLNLNGHITGGTTSLYINQGGKPFKDIHDEIGMNEAIYTMGCNYGDINNDGWLDFYLATGNPSFFSIIPNKMYVNNKGIGVYDVSYASGMAHIQKGHGISMADVDRDGDLDIYAVMGGAYEGDNFQNAFFQNPGNKNSWIVLDLEGVQSNKKAIGARVKIVIDENGKERSIYRTVNSGASFGANSLELEVGLGKAQSVKMVEIKWPHTSRMVQKITNLDVNTWYKIVEGQKTISKIDAKAIIFEKNQSRLHH